ELNQPFPLLVLGLPLKRLCLFPGSFTTATKESYAHPYAQASKDSCDGTWSFLKPCTQHKIVYKTAYRQAVKIDYRKRYRCCQGYYENADVCVPSCTKECVHGRCVAPDQCQCEQGWRGADCSSMCDGRSWGPHCENPCQCGDGGACDPLTGACVCSPGYKDPMCKDPCDPGTYGEGCQLDCPCKNAPKCHGETGACLCQPGFTGTIPSNRGARGRPVSVVRGPPTLSPGVPRVGTSLTLLFHCLQGTICSIPCPQGWYGSGCLGECQCHNNGLCDPIAGRCQCALGYTGERCREECPIGKYGQDCGQPCDCANGGRCFHINGACLCDAGFYGPRCEERACLDGLYGLACHLPCLCSPQHSQSCHPISGECTCQPGWAGLHCNETCPHGYHGANCQEPCLCLNGGTCDGATGLCRCTPGYTGEHCSSHCPADTYGVNCSLRCACKNAFACSPLDGTCVCKEGWHGGDCSSPCLAGTWGPGCNETCRCVNGAACSPVSGACSCAAGWHGSRCQDPCANGAYGPGCSSHCDCSHADTCSPVTGQCHCLPGWTGPRCSRACDDGFWGRNCSQPCACKNGAACSSEDGSCSCAPGYRGPACQRRKCPANRASGRPCVPVTCPLWGGSKEFCLPGPLCRGSCQPGRYGKKCTMPCRCSNHSTCHHVDGSCACFPGHCSEGCPLGSYGENCAQACQCQNAAQCDPATGRCLCPSGYTGAHCDARSPEHPFTMVPAVPVGYSSLGAIIGIIVLVILLVALLVFFLCYRHWQKGKENRHLAVAYTTGRTDSSEYAVPDVPPNYTHYYSNPSYHTLSRCMPTSPAPTSQDRASSLKNMAYGPDCNASLPADWKHHGRRLRHTCLELDRASKLLSSRLNRRPITQPPPPQLLPLPVFTRPPAHPPDYIKEEALRASSSSLNSENPYATIKDLPELMAKPSEGSYMEMKSPVKREMSYAEIGLFEEPAAGSRAEEGVSPAAPSVPPNHYDSPKNSHIPSHYDMPPVRHYPPSPPLRRQDR
uniref:Platelet endothelial aggregation receptor 1 n=1 Tax=Chelydra serpentina TaxID=8475 RepID=A0A8C3RXX9_CHESE